MPQTIEAPEPDVDVAPVRISDEQIAKERAAAARLPDKPMDAATSDVILHPSDAFNTMADKLDKAMKEVHSQQRQPDKSQEATLLPEEKKAPADPKAPAEPPAEAPEEKTITSAKAADWKALKEKIKTFETQAKDFEQKHTLVAKEYEEFKKKAVDMAQMEQANKKLTELETERNTLKKQIELVALERSDEFKNAYTSRFTEALSRAKDAVGATKADTVEGLLQLPPSKWRKEQINVIREELDGVDQGQLDVAIADYDRARNERENALKNGEDSYKKLLGIQSEKANRKRELDMHRIEAAVATAIDFARNNFESFKPSDKEEQMAAVKANEDRLRKYFTGQLEGKDIYLMPMQAAEHDRLTKSVIPEMQKKIKELESTVAQYEQSNPRPGGGRVGDTLQSIAPTGNKFIDKFMKERPHGS